MVAGFSLKYMNQGINRLPLCDNDHATAGNAKAKKKAF